MHWDASKPGLPLFRQIRGGSRRRGDEGAREIQSAPDDTQRIVLEQKHKQVEKSVELVRVLGDAVHFGLLHRGQGESAREAPCHDRELGLRHRRGEMERAARRRGEPALRRASAAAVSLGGRVPGGRSTGERQQSAASMPSSAIRHLPVRTRSLPATATTIYLGSRCCTKARTAMLISLRTSSAAPSDLLRQDRTFGLIATNTDRSRRHTRHGPCHHNCAKAAQSHARSRRLKWPSEAAVIVSVVHVSQGLPFARRSSMAGKCGASRLISLKAILIVLRRGLKTNARKAFQGSIVLGIGFTFDDAAAAKGEAESLDDHARADCEGPAQRGANLCLYRRRGGQHFANARASSVCHRLRRFPASA